jgi:hypothetical protein
MNVTPTSLLHKVQGMIMLTAKTDSILSVRMFIYSFDLLYIHPFCFYQFFANPWHYSTNGDTQ